MKNCTNSLLIVCMLLLSLSAQSQLVVKGNVPSRKTSGTPVPTGSAVLGAFEGRTPCKEILQVLNMQPVPSCWKMKWSLTLYLDPVTKQPSHFALRGTYANHETKEGKWSITHGMPGNPDAVLYELEMNAPESVLYLLKGDEHVLFMLDKNKNFLKGNADWSYTLNRVVNWIFAGILL